MLQHTGGDHAGWSLGQALIGTIRYIYIYGSGQALFNHQTFHAEIAGALVYCIPIRGPCSLKTVPQ